jgi:phosphoserine phosphatase
MKYGTPFYKIMLVGLFTLFHSIHADEMHTKTIVEKILHTKQAILDSSEKPSSKFIFLTFWDFDGTILKGDCSEGLESDGKPVYKGLAQLAIESGYSEIYPPKGGVKRFFDDYHHMEHLGKWLAYPYLLQMLRGAQKSDIDALSQKHFKTVLSHYYFSSSMRMLAALEKSGIECHIISASGDIFIDAAAPTLKLDRKRFNGIEQRIKNGRLSEELVYPVTWSEGKVEKLRALVDKISKQNPNKQVVVLAAFGNSYGTDGPFLKYVATQKLPAGEPVAVMINGGNPPSAYTDLFIQVQQSHTVSDEL